MRTTASTRKRPTPTPTVVINASGLTTSLICPASTERSGSATVISVIIAIFAAYAMSRYKFFGRGLFSTTVLSTQMFPGVLFLLPLFLIVVNINTVLGIQLVGTRIGLIITYLTFSLPFSIWMLAGYFDGIPREFSTISATVTTPFSFAALK